ncbi:MAG: hypothetical protein KBT69_07770 [Oceanihabitans sp.]|nr:hypothetical protein [Oceanihabitans sp.]
MKKRIDSTFYFLQYLVWRIFIVYGIGFFVYSLITKETGGIIAVLLAVFVATYVSIKKLPKPTDLTFDENFLYLDKVSYPIEFEKIKAIENGVILYKVDGEIINITMPRYCFLDKNYKELKNIIEQKATG